MSARHKLVALALTSLVACSAPMAVGPYVKSITRRGDSLFVVSCQIVLDHDDFYEGECSSQDIPLHRPADAPPPAAASAHR